MVIKKKRRRKKRGVRKKRGTLHADLVKHLRRGNYREVACRLVGIKPGTLTEWLLDAETHMEESDYWQLYHDVHEAEAEAEARMVRLVNRGAMDDARFAIEFLQRKYPKRWAKTTKTELSGPEGKPIEMGSIRVDFNRKLDEAGKRIKGGKR